MREMSAVEIALYVTMVIAIRMQILNAEQEKRVHQDNVHVQIPVRL